MECLNQILPRLFIFQQVISKFTKHIIVALLSLQTDVVSILKRAS